MIHSILHSLVMICLARTPGCHCNKYQPAPEAPYRRRSEKTAAPASPEFAQELVDKTTDVSVAIRRKNGVTKYGKGTRNCYQKQ
jgi:hypothetical protein